MYKNQSKTDQKYKCKSWTYKTLKRNRGIHFHNLGLGNSFLDMAPKHKQYESKWYTLRQHIWATEMTQWVTCFLGKHEDLSLFLRTQGWGKPRVVACFSNPSTGEADTAGSLGFDTQPAYSIWWAPDQSERLTKQTNTHTSQTNGQTNKTSWKALKVH